MRFRSLIFAGVLTLALAGSTTPAFAAPQRVASCAYHIVAENTADGTVGNASYSLAARLLYDSCGNYKTDAQMYVSANFPGGYQLEGVIDANYYYTCWTSANYVSGHQPECSTASSTSGHGYWVGAAATLYHGMTFINQAYVDYYNP